MQKKSSRSGRSRKNVAFGQKEKKRLVQLGLCLCLFLVVLLGRSSELLEKSATGEKLLQLIQKDTDFVGAFSSLGESVSQGKDVWDELGTLVMDLFGAPSEEEHKNTALVFDGPAAKNAVRALSETKTTNAKLHFVGTEAVESKGEEMDAEPDVELPQDLDEEKTMIPEKPEVPEYTGPALPANATMEYYDLGLQTTVTPVLGEISSPYGYRDHPISGEYLFHAGVDIAADVGTPIAAFADGVVEFIGESSAYGLYIQLDHGSGIKSFYCHCSKLLYGKGRSVTAGETIAAVGDTGNTTGPHLHLELKKEETLLNPAYYIDSEKQQ